MRLALSLFFSLAVFCFSTHAMENSHDAPDIIQIDENSEDIYGLTLKDALAILEKKQFEKLGYTQAFIGTIGFGIPFLFIPGLVPGALLAGLGCSISGFENWCTGGIVCLSFGPCLSALAFFSPLFVKFFNLFAEYYTQQREIISCAIRAELLLLSGEDRDLSSHELNALIPYIYALDSGLLQKVTLDQALVFFKSGSTNMRFSPSINSLLLKLKHLSKMPAEVLAQELTTHETQELFCNYPLLFETLVQLQPMHLKNPLLRDSYLECLEKIRTKYNLIIDAHTLLDTIANGESVLITPAPSAVSLEHMISMQAAYSSIEIDKRALLSLSGLYRNLAESELLTDIIKLEKYPQVLAIFDQLAKGCIIKITDDNLLELLTISHYYLIESLFKNCETYICSPSGLPKAVLKQWDQENNYIGAANYLADSFRFGHAFKLHNFTEQQLTQLAIKLNSYKNLDKLFEDIIILDTDMQNLIFKDYFNITQFYEVLKLKDKLASYVQIAEKFDIKAFNKILYDFVHAPQNAALIEQTWYKIPAAFAKQS
jgi:hypothetical protein